MKASNTQDNETKNKMVWYGPMPDPEILKAYEEIASGEMLNWWKELVKTEASRFEQERERIYELERMKVQLRADAEKRGQICGLIIGLSALLVGSITSIMGAQWSGGFIGAGGVVGLVAVFVLGRKIKRDNDQTQ